MTLLQTVLLALVLALGGIEVRRRLGTGIRSLGLDQGDLHLLRRVFLTALAVVGLLYLIAIAVAAGGDQLL